MLHRGKTSPKCAHKIEILTITLKVEGWDKSKMALSPGGRHWLCSVSEPGVESPALSWGVPSHHAPCAVMTLRIYHFPEEDLALDKACADRPLPFISQSSANRNRELGPVPHPTSFTKYPSLDWPLRHFCETAVMTSSFAKWNQSAI